MPSGFAPGSSAKRSPGPAALDLTAETFAQAWRSVKRIRDEADGSGAPWCSGSLATCCASTTSTTGSRPRRTTGSGLPLAFAESEEYERVDDRIAASTMGPALQTAVEGLPSEQRRALELRVVQQLSYDEVAGRLGCSQNAARLRVSRALRTLTLELGRAEGPAG